MLTKRQKQVLNFIKSFKEKHDYSPSLEETREHFLWSSVSTAHFHINHLQEMGYLRREENQPRAINVFEGEQMVQIALSGTIAAGEPIEAIEDKEIIAIPKSKLPKSGEFYALRIEGESMINENIDDGDIVIIKNQPVAQDGQRVVALIHNEEATLKRYYKHKGKVELRPANPKMESMFFRPSQVLVQGIVIDVIKSEPDLEVEILETLVEKSDFSKENHQKEKTLKKWTNTIQCMDCVKGMRQLPDNSIDLIVTSPPYDSIRKYNGFSYDLHATGKEIHRILKEGGMAVMVIQDQTKNFGKTLTSFKAIIDWCDNVGFKLFETVIYKKQGGEGAWWTKRFRVDHEYMPIFLKGKRPQYFDKEPLKIPSKHGGKLMTGCATRLTNGKTLPSKKVRINMMKCRGTIWNYSTCGDGTRMKHEHPATFPDKIPFDLVQCFCPPKGIVLDPFMGSGTTALAAIELERKYIGFDVSKEYCALSRKRIKEEGKRNKKLF